MSTNGEQMKILQMIQDGKISAEEGARLLAAARPAQAPAAEPAPAPVEKEIVAEKASPVEVMPGDDGGRKGWFRVRVTDMRTERTKVTVNLPLSLMAAGMKIGARYSPELEGLDLTELLSELKTSNAGKIIDVLDEEDGEHVEIFIE